MGVPTGTAIIGHHFDDFSWKCHGPSRGVCRIEFVCPRMQGGRRHSTVCSGMEFGTNSVQLRERKNGFLAPKRHKMKHLDFLILLLEYRGSWCKTTRPTILSLVVLGHRSEKRVFRQVHRFGKCACRAIDQVRRFSRGSAWSFARWSGVGNR